MFNIIFIACEFFFAVYITKEKNVVKRGTTMLRPTTNKLCIEK